MIFRSIADAIGNTPLLSLDAFAAEHGLDARLYAKLESFNPAGSVKDRVAKYMVEDAEQNGKLKPGGTIIEPTSGNTGIGLALIAAVKGYRAIFTMPETMSVERRKLLKAYGAELVLTDGAKGMKGAIEKAEELLSSSPDAYMPGQFTNPSNQRAHFETTGPEIWEQVGGKVDIFAACVGTGGTFSGTGRYLKSKNPDIKIFAVEPDASPVLSGGKAGAHKIQGIGAGFVPGCFDASLCDGIIRVSDDDAFMYAAAIAKTQGILAGISSGAAAFAVATIAKMDGNRGKNIVTVFPDGGERYLSL